VNIKLNILSYYLAAAEPAKAAAVKVVAADGTVEAVEQLSSSG